MNNATQPVNIRLSKDLIQYLETYQKQHGLATRTEVVIKAIQQLRAQELIDGYKAMSRQHALHPDPLADRSSNYGLEPSTEEDW